MPDPAQVDTPIWQPCWLRYVEWAGRWLLLHGDPVVYFVCYGSVPARDPTKHTHYLATTDLGEAEGIFGELEEALRLGLL